MNLHTEKDIKLKNFRGKKNYIYKPRISFKRKLETKAKQILS